MFLFAFQIGIFTYLIFFLGLLGLLYEPLIIILTVIYWLMVLLWHRKRLGYNIKNKPQLLIKKHTLLFILLMLLILQTLANLIGALSPELAFDALWYHLELPKLYLENNAIFYVPGGLLYYSVMPKLGEMLYIPALAIGNQITAKLIHFSFSIFTAVIIYQFSRKFFTPLISVLAVIIFYSNLVVAWEATTAYIDLIRTFYEVLALWAFVLWWQTERKKWLFTSALLLGFAVTTKLLAFSSLFIFLVLIVYKCMLVRRSSDQNIFLSIQFFWKKLVSNSTLFIITTVLIPLPWFVFAYINTGNPVYPFFSQLYAIHPEPLSLTGFFVDIWNVLIRSADPISPVYLVFLPLMLITYSKLRTEMKLLVWYCAISLVMWYFTPRTGGGRFLLPYLPVFSILCAGIYAVILEQKAKVYTNVSYILIGVIIFTAITTFSYRMAASYQYLPVMTGQVTKETFLSNNLDFAFADFYDTDGYFAENIKSTDNVLLYGFHNLYYVNFPYVHETWIKKGDAFNYVATQRAALPEEFADWQLIYTNKKTMVNLYKPPPGECNPLCSY